MRPRRTAVVVSVLALALTVGGTQIVQADGPQAVAAKKCKKKKKRKRCRKPVAPPTSAPTSTAPATTTTSTPPAPHTLTVGVPVNGSVSSSPAGIDCPGDCSEVFPAGQVVTLTPQPDVGYEFTGWGGDCYDNPCVLTMDADHVATPHFGIPQETLTVSFDSGQGRVTSSTGGIDCEQTGSGTTGNCYEQLDQGASVTLTAVSPNPNPDFWIFSSWGGDCSLAFTNQCTLSMTQGRSASVTFVQT